MPTKNPRVKKPIRLPITKRAGIPLILWEDIEKEFGPELYQEFIKWMTGQTCMEDGVYVWDVRQFIEGGDDLEWAAPVFRD